ncbi:Protein of unknown function [Pyronema omphalodes CBS 100304]|uniref:Uncharacterized protein n=1 Tax=Pyronema omphalodes (strain CBS 100304) TaxID=1076935 RepID=U4KZ04_PYROM|nr:Protein of unknown function [Pyronema omphalodes CBS 100304]
MCPPSNSSPPDKPLPELPVLKQTAEPRTPIAKHSPRALFAPIIWFSQETNGCFACLGCETKPIFQEFNDLRTHLDDKHPATIDSIFHRCECDNRTYLGFTNYMCASVWLSRLGKKKY